MEPGSALLETEAGAPIRKSPGSRDPCILPCQAEGRSLNEKSEWREIHGRGSRRTPSLPTMSPTPVPLKNRSEVLVEEGQSNEDVDDGQSTPEMSPQLEWCTARITTTTPRKKRRVMVVGDSFLRRTEGPICRVDPPHREVCCLPGARLKDITRKLPRLIQSSGYSPLLIFLVGGGEEAATHRPRAIKGDFRALGRLVRESGTPVIFSSLLPVAGSDIVRNRWIQSINTWLCGWCRHHSFVLCDNGMAYAAPGLLASNGRHLSQRGKRVFAHELAGLIDRALN